jgi:glycosyltransferase involved in cell wall biosynthesis
MMQEYPLISCICVTRRKPVMLERAIRCFSAQTYPNKELVILYEDDDDETEFFISQLPPSDEIKVVTVPRSPGIKLGQLRNISIQAASGAYICQWDDDDWYHISRLEYQYRQLTESSSPGSILMVWLIFDATTGRSYISNSRPWEGSVLCAKEILLNTKYENRSSGEDTAVVEALLSAGHLHAIARVPWLYIYVYHGSNTFDHDHWKRIFASSLLQPDAFNAEVGKIVTQDYDVVSASLMLNEQARSMGVTAPGVNA